MSFLTLNIGILAFADTIKSAQPDVRLADIKWSLQGLPTNNFKQIPISLAPGETMTVASTSRSISFTGSTTFTVSKIDSNMKIQGNFGQSIVKQDSATEWTFTKSPNNVCKLEATGGSAATLTSITAGDTVELGNEFNIRNRGQYLVLKVTSTTIEFINELASTETSSIVGDVKVFKKKVQVGDILDLTSAEFAFPNRGTFPVSKVGADYIEVANSDAFPETVTNVTSGFVVYPFAYKWVMAAVDHKTLMSLNESNVMSIEIEPPVEGDLAKNPGLFIKRGKVFQITLSNPGIETVNGFLILAE